MSTAASHTAAVVERDCASRLRITYVLPRAVELSELEELVDGDLQIDEFSRFVADADDHFKFRVSRYSFASGTIGGRSLIVTYGKLGADARPEDRDRVEACLASCYGPISDPEISAAAGTSR